MEIEGLGARCTLPTCRRLDFLPLTCATCARPFCSEHHEPSAHTCTAPPVRRDVPTCPLCSQPVPTPASSTPDAAVSRHIASGCPRRVRTNPTCALPTCTARDPVATRCPACHRSFCLAHRHEADHHCRAAPAARQGVDPFGNPLANPARKPALASTTSKPRLSPGRLFRKGPDPRHPHPVVARSDHRIRLDFSNSPANPVGDTAVDPEDRVHIAFFFPRAAEMQPRHMYFSRRQSAGRIVDVVRRDVKGIPNPPQGVRYSLYAVRRGGDGVNLLPHITPLKDLPKGLLQNGDALVMECGEDGLDQAWVAALRKAGGSSRLALGRRSGSTGTSQKVKCTVT